MLNPSKIIAVNWQNGEKMAKPNMTIAEEFGARIKSEAKRDRIIRLAPLLVLLGLILFFVVALGGDFASVGNFEAILNQMAIPLLIAIGLTFVIILGSIDLSIDGAVGFGAAVMSLLVLNNKNGNDLGLIGIIIAIAACVLIGFFIGLIHVKLKVPSFMVSFSFMFVAQGLGTLLYEAIPAQIEDPILQEIPKMSFIGLPIITLVAIVVLAFAYFLQEYTAFGRHMYSVCTAENIPRVAGIKVDKVKIMVFMFAGLCYGIAGVLSGIRLGQGQVMVGDGTMFPAQAAVVVGGTALSGGKGGVINTLVGVLIMTVLENGLILLGVNPVIKDGIQGLVIIVAVALTVSRSKKTVCK